MELSEEYIASVKRRSFFRFLLGLVSRFFIFIKFALFRLIARFRGAEIGRGAMMSYKLAKKANKNLKIGDCSIIGTSQIDLRCKVSIGKNVIITSDTCKIITLSHDIDNPRWPLKYGGIEIEDFVWIPTDVLILPGCKRIGYGAVIGSGSVVAHNVREMSVVGGNPCIEIKERKCVHSQHLMEESQTADLVSYWNAYWRK